jgi:DNA-binding NarL/FixJ family response regulator
MYPGSLPDADDRAGGDALRVLLVDDSWSFLSTAEHFLATEPDIQVVGCVSSGRDALAQIPLLRPDIVVMDVAMPRMSGFKAGRLVKHMPHAPRVVLLGRESRAGRLRAAAMGADGFLPKSELGSGLLPMIRNIFGLSCDRPR